MKEPHHQESVCRQKDGSFLIHTGNRSKLSTFNSYKNWCLSKKELPSGEHVWPASQDKFQRYHKKHFPNVIFGIDTTTELQFNKLVREFRLTAAGKQVHEIQVRGTRAFKQELLLKGKETMEAKGTPRPKDQLRYESIAKRKHLKKITPKKIDNLLKREATWRKSNKRWVKQQIDLFQAFTLFVQACKEAGLEAPRGDWTQFCGRDRNLIFIGAILSTNIADVTLFNALVALKRHGCLSLEALATMDLVELQSLLNHTGYNHWSRNAAHVIGACLHAKEHNKGRCPADKYALLMLYGVGRKVFALIWACALGRRGEYIAVDSHLLAVFSFLNWAEPGSADAVACQVEHWFPPECFELVNEVFGGIRQLWNGGKENKAEMTTIATKIEKTTGMKGFADKLFGLCAAAKPETPNKGKKEQRTKEQQKLAASMAAWRNPS